MCHRAERATLENFCIYNFQNSYFFNVWVGTYEFCRHNMTCLSVILLHLYNKCSFPFIYYLWHGTNIRLTTYRQNTHIEIIYICMHASEQSERGKCFPFLHSKPTISVIILVGTSDPGGGGALPYWRWRGRAAGQGMIFTVIHIGTGYLNRPNWLLAGYSVYHRVASRLPMPGSQPTMFMTGPQSRHQRRDGVCGTTMFMTGPRSPRSGTSDGAGRNRFLWMYDDTQQNRESVRTNTRVCIWQF